MANHYTTWRISFGHQDMDGDAESTSVMFKDILEDLFENSLNVAYFDIESESYGDVNTPIDDYYSEDD